MNSFPVFIVYWTEHDSFFWHNDRLGLFGRQQRRREVEEKRSSERKLDRRSWPVSCISSYQQGRREVQAAYNTISPLDPMSGGLYFCYEYTSCTWSEWKSAWWLLQFEGGQGLHQLINQVYRVIDWLRS